MPPQTILIALIIIGIVPLVLVVGSAFLRRKSHGPPWRP
jgi:hypothetical protein